MRVASRSFGQNAQVVKADMAMRTGRDRLCTTQSSASVKLLRNPSQSHPDPAHFRLRALLDLRREDLSYSHNRHMTWDALLRNSNA